MPGPPAPHSFFATCAAGTEVALRDELKALGLYRVRADRGGARFVGELAHGLRACIGSRIASRVLLAIGELDAPDQHALYEGVHALAWEQWLGPTQTLAVSAVSRESAIHHTAFLAQKTKDAIVDRIREREGARPSVDRRRPDVAIFVHLVRDRARVFLDVSGEALHARGYRSAIGEAPLKETLAAAILALAGWRGDRPLLDPCCGAGTIAIEADLAARGVAPGIARGLGIERWRSWDEALATALADERERARAAERATGPLISGSDVDAHAIDAARANAARARSAARFSIASARDAEVPGAPALVIANPPYGERLDDAERALSEIASLAARAPGHRLALLLREPPPPRWFPPPLEVHRLRNGPLEVGLCVWDT